MGDMHLLVLVGLRWVVVARRVGVCHFSSNSRTAELAFRGAGGARVQQKISVDVIISQECIRKRYYFKDMPVLRISS
jgi:hypothetical protein